MEQNQLTEAFEAIKVIGYKELRPWDIFFSSFQVPQWESKHLQQRMSTNSIYFRSNYAVVCLVLLGLRIVFSPMLLIELLLVGALCFYGIFVVKHPVAVGEFVIDSRERLIICVVTSFLFMTLTGAMASLLWSFILCFVLCGSHMVFHIRNYSSDPSQMNPNSRPEDDVEGGKNDNAW